MALRWKLGILHWTAVLGELGSSTLDLARNMFLRKLHPSFSGQTCPWIEVPSIQLPERCRCLFLGRSPGGLTLTHERVGPWQ